MPERLFEPDIEEVQLPPSARKFFFMQSRGIGQTIQLLVARFIEQLRNRLFVLLHRIYVSPVIGVQAGEVRNAGHARAGRCL